MVAASIQKLGCWKFISIFFSTGDLQKDDDPGFSFSGSDVSDVHRLPLNYKVIVSTL